MTGWVGGTGVPPRRIGIGAAAVLAAAALVGFVASDAAHRRAPRPPLLGDPGTLGSPAALGLDSTWPREPVAMLFFQGRPAIPVPDGRRVLVSESGAVLSSDRELRVRPLSLALGGRGALGAAPAGFGGWWVSTLEGELARFDREGRLVQATAAPFGATALWPDPLTGGAFATRSPERFAFLPEPAESPLVVALDAGGQTRAGAGSLIIPQHSLLATLANAGYAAATGDTVFFAPLSRSEIVAFGPAGDTLWVSRATEVPPTPEPVITLAGGGQVRVDYQPLNLAMTLGPDGRLYVLRAVDTAVERARVDVLEAGSGRVIWRADLGSPRATLAANRLGRVYLLDEDRLLGTIPASAREPLPDFDLPRLGGGGLSLGELSGRVVLVNFWASWCIPCRAEMPALDSLGVALRGAGLVLVAISEDENRKDAERFVAELGLAIPVVFGDGRLRSRFHYPGLPYTLLVDWQGRVVRRWIGQLGPGDVELIGLLARQEMAGSAPSRHPANHDQHRP